ncbi:MAG: flavodoxin family protein [Spirochaetaceae bacterium]|jgi:multimeric flavodoxin WrbA|nr:flavodoxin family protein [Spirochaetaceae bacterium]
MNKILEGAEARGAETKLWNFSDVDIKPCNSCWGCKNGEHGCVIKDDMRKLYDALDKADALVLGTPVYMGQMSAQAKIFTDRLFASSQFSPRFSPYFKETNAARKKLIIVFTQGNPDAGKFQVYFDYTKDMFQFLNFDVKDIVVVAGMRNEAARERKDLDAAMKACGSSLVLG